MSLVIAAPGTVAAAATDIAAIASSLRAANTAAAASTTQVVAAAVAGHRSHWRCALDPGAGYAGGFPIYQQTVGSAPETPVGGTSALNTGNTPFEVMPIYLSYLVSGGESFFDA